jgi:hypothetical protein
VTTVVVWAQAQPPAAAGASDSTRASTRGGSAAAWALAAARPPPHADTPLLVRQAAALFCASAVLGPLCDGLHSTAGVLHYERPSVLASLQLPGGFSWGLETCWWVPLLFGVAGVILGVGTPVLDELSAARRREQRLSSGGPPGQRAAGPPEVPSSAGADAAAVGAPGWPAVLFCIALFVSQYWLSGWLEQHLLGAGGAASAAGGAAAAGGVAAAGPPPSTWPVEDGVLLATAVALWAAFDRTPQVCAPGVAQGGRLQGERQEKARSTHSAALPPPPPHPWPPRPALHAPPHPGPPQGATMAALTAACGPAVEIGLINLLGLYHYTHPQWLGVPVWIPWVYAAGGPGPRSGSERGHSRAYTGARWGGAYGGALHRPASGALGHLPKGAQLFMQDFQTRSGGRSAHPTPHRTCPLVLRPQAARLSAVSGDRCGPSSRSSGRGASGDAALPRLGCGNRSLLRSTA